ncbi:MAG: hypothetical protein ACREPN_12855 [Rudaea sp.]
MIAATQNVRERAMRIFHWVRRIFPFVALCATVPAFAGVPAASIIGGSATSLFSPGIGSAGPTKTITLTFSGSSSVGAQLATLATAGANAGDFAIVGGTCAPGSTVLDTGSPTCSVIVQYTASGAGAESAQLTGNCTSVGLIGGFSLSCSGTTGPLTSLMGALIAALASTPLLDPKLLTVLCLLLLGIGTYFANRKRA